MKAVYISCRSYRLRTHAGTHTPMHKFTVFGFAGGPWLTPWCLCQHQMFMLTLSPRFWRHQPHPSVPSTSSCSPPLLCDPLSHCLSLQEERENICRKNGMNARCFYVGGFSGRHPRRTVKTEPIKLSDESSGQIRGIARAKDTLLLQCCWCSHSETKTRSCDQSCDQVKSSQIYNE